VDCLSVTSAVDPAEKPGDGNPLGAIGVNFGIDENIALDEVGVVLEKSGF
jgi:hypothetical protein